MTRARDVMQTWPVAGLEWADSRARKVIINGACAIAYKVCLRLKSAITLAETDWMGTVDLTMTSIGDTKLLVELQCAKMSTM